MKQELLQQDGQQIVNEHQVSHYLSFPAVQCLSLMFFLRQHQMTIDLFAVILILCPNNEHSQALLGDLMKLDCANVKKWNINETKNIHFSNKVVVQFRFSQITTTLVLERNIVEGILSRYISA